MSLDLKDPKYWEDLLALEGLGDIDKNEGFRQVSVRTDVSKITDKEKFISDLEKKFGVFFQIDEEIIEVNMLKDGVLVGSIKTRYYSHGNVQVENHLEKILDEEHRGKGLGQAMYDVWRVMGFPIPKKEVSREPSNILFLLKNGYTIVSRFDDSGIEIELSSGEIASLEKGLEGIKGDLPFTYKLSLI